MCFRYLPIEEAWSRVLCILAFEYFEASYFMISNILDPNINRKHKPIQILVLVPIRHRNHTLNRHLGIAPKALRHILFNRWLVHILARHNMIKTVCNPSDILFGCYKCFVGTFRNDKFLKFIHEIVLYRLLLNVIQNLVYVMVLSNYAGF